MRLFKLSLILSLIFMQFSCIREARPRTEMDANMIQSLEGPRIIRDTIIQTVILDTVYSGNDVAQVEQPKKVTKSKPSTPAQRYEADDYDRGNSGFFDNYRSSYDGDPNRGLKTTTRTVKTNASEIERKKEAIEKSLDILEQRNQQEQERYDKLEQERQAINAKAIRDAKEKQRQQNQQQQRPQGQTLDTNLLLDNK